ncbi:hypothetical protein LXH13_18045 [Streptomyces spinosirectus]|uniref:hypothetical protein n=1 Tax=Streptomyces TaxID=1883 RepID=UPI001C9E19FF|nr:MULTISPECIES: hypothetical protein [Streptomyces]MBY8340209.1 hypothetical protein [Streptomyces plumbidurans]UIR18832.1 hypothetical protein LXH13_18045 [Streptomyces spinosirectus]
MARRRPEPVVEAVPWSEVTWFSVSDVVRPSTLRRKKLTGRIAVRVPKTYDGVRYFAPSVLVSATEDETPSYTLHDATRPDTLLCSLTPEKRGARYRVADERGADIGLLHRTPAAKRAVQHSWWLQQPGHADVVARYRWARGSAKDVAERGRDTLVRGAGSFVGSVVDTVISLGVEDTAAGSSYTPKPITWLADGDPEPVALTAGHVDGITTYLLKASWLDSRLAFALGVLREA